jgi:hypothetical protein
MVSIGEQATRATVARRVGRGIAAAGRPWRRGGQPARVHLDDADRLVAAAARSDFAGLEIHHRAIVRGAYFEQALEQGDGRGLVMRRHVELRALHHSHEVGRLHAQLAGTALADVVEGVATWLDDAIDRPARRRERGKLQDCLRSHAHRGEALPELDGAITAGAQGGGQLEDGTGAHRARRALHGDVHLALRADHEDVAGIERERRRRGESRHQHQRHRAHQTNYRGGAGNIMVIAGHGPNSPSPNSGECY